MNVWALPEVIEELEKLIDVLYEKGYFSYEQSSINYVIDLFEDIKTDLPFRLKKRAPKHFENLYGKGLYYAVFPKSKRTQWYVFFRMYEKDNNIYYQVRNISNNHIVAKYLDLGFR